MKWSLHTDSHYLSLARDQFEATIPDAYLSISTDERIAETVFSNNLVDYFSQEKIVPVQEIEKIALLVGPNAVSILGSPRSPVKTVVTTFLGSRAGTASTQGASGTTRITISISAFKGDNLVDGVPLARKLAAGLGIIDESSSSLDFSGISRFLQFGVNSGFSDALEVHSVVEADSICKAMINSVSFQRIIQYVSVHVRIGLACWSDLSTDGDDAPHWINKSVVSMWFVSSRHLPEFLERARSSMKQESSFRFIAGFGRVRNEESAACVADAAALAWHLMVNSGKLTPMTMIGRSRFSFESGEASPKTKALREGAKFAVEKRASLVARATDLMNAKEFQTNGTTDEALAEIKRLQEFLVALGHSHDQAESQFKEAAKNLETERATFRLLEEQLQTASLETTKLQTSISEQDATRKALLQDISTLTSKKDSVLKAVAEEETLLEQETSNRNNQQAETERKFSKEYDRMQRDFDQLQQQLSDEEMKLQIEIDEDGDRVSRTIEQFREESDRKVAASSDFLETKRAELGAMRSQLSRLDADLKESQELCHRRKVETAVLVAEFDKVMQSYSSAGDLNQALQKYYDQCQFAEAEKRSLGAKLEHVRNMARQVRANRESQEDSLIQSQSSLLEHDEQLRQLRHGQKRDEISTCEELERLDRLCVEEGEKVAWTTRKWAVGHVVVQQSSREHLADVTKRRNHLNDTLLDLTTSIHKIETENDAFDQQMLATREEISQAEKQRGEIEADLQHSLQEIRAEKYKLQQGVAGSEDNKFPLLMAQKKEFEEKLSLLRLCISTSSLHTAEKGVSLLVNRRALVDTAETFLTRIDQLHRRAQSEVDSRQRTAESLQKKQKHLCDEIELREKLLNNIDNAEAIQRERIQSIRTDAHSAQTKLTDSVTHFLSVNDILSLLSSVENASDQEFLDLVQRKRTVLNSLNATKRHLATLESEAADTETTIHQLQRSTLLHR